jgi:hypothetical protein
MSFDGGAIAQQMIGAGSQAFGENWQVARGFAEAEFKTLGARLQTIAEQTAQGMDPAIAKSLFDAQVRTAVQIIAGATALTLLAVEAAINAIIDVIRGALNQAIGFVLV